MILVLVGESASGKSTIEKMIQEYIPSFSKVISYTTRPPRNGETDGVDYHFISDAAFEAMDDECAFIERAEYRGWKYGSAKWDYNDGQDRVAVLTPHGCRSLKRWAKANKVRVISVYFDVDRRSRLMKLLQRGDDIDEAYRRSLSDVGQFDGFADEADFVIENHEFKKSAEQIFEDIDFIIDEVRLSEYI